MDKLRKIYQDSVDYIIPKEFRKIFLLLLKEYDDINNENLNDIKELKLKNEELINKLKTMENENNILKKKLEENDDELNIIKKQLIENIENFNNQNNYDKQFNDEYEEDENENENEEKYEEITSKSLVLDSLNDLNEKIDCSSFIPIAMKEMKTENKLKVTGVPKLNFDIIKNSQQIKKNLNHKMNNKAKKTHDNIMNKSK
jgi:hypothetical protein